MSGFTLDTSGSVLHERYPDAPGAATRWSDLSPFAQGYVEAALSGSVMIRRCDRDLMPDVVCFRNLAPATLAAMLADCDKFRERLPGWDHKDGGALFWSNRKSGFGPVGAKHWPPIALYLGEDGKIHQREAGA